MTAAPSQWRGRPERGNRFVVGLIIALTRGLGRPVGRALLYPIAAYFWLFSPRPRAASRAYLSAVLGRPARARETYAHYLCFSQVLLDRALFALGYRSARTARVHNMPIAAQVIGHQRGCLFVGAHFGSYDLLRSAADLGVLRVKILMRPETNRQFVGVMGPLNPAWAKDVIALGQPGSMLAARDHLQSGGVIGLLADRAAERDHLVAVPFLGGTAQFALGPFELARILKVPVVAFFGVYHGGDDYEIRFESVAGDPATDGEAYAGIAAASFAGHLEAACRMAPYNWFNFYDFWATPTLR